MKRRPLRTLRLTDRAERGVFIASWMGPRGEFELLAITADRRLLTGAPVRIPLGADHAAKADELWLLLDERDPLRPQHLRIEP